MVLGLEAFLQSWRTRRRPWVQAFPRMRVLGFLRQLNEGSRDPKGGLSPLNHGLSLFGIMVLVEFGDQLKTRLLFPYPYQIFGLFQSVSKPF